MEKLLKETNKEREQRRIDMDLFGLLFPLFDCMSIRGKETTINTLRLYLIMEEE